MRILLVTLALCFAAACTQKPAEAEGAPAPAKNAADANGESASEGEIVDVTGDQPKSIEDMRAESLAAIDRAACEAGGGEVRQEGMLGMYRCVTPYADAGKECRSGSDCEGKCLARDGAMTGEETIGACQANDSPFGCYAEVEDGKVTNALCVD